MAPSYEERLRAAEAKAQSAREAVDSGFRMGTRSVRACTALPRRRAGLFSDTQPPWLAPKREIFSKFRDVGLKNHITIYENGGSINLSGVNEKWDEDQ